MAVIETRDLSPIARRMMSFEYIRIYAATTVFLTHKFPQFATVTVDKTSIATVVLGDIYNAIVPILWTGLPAVTAFFLISGYIIMSAIDREHTGQFAINRIFRIYPMYILAVLMEFALTDRIPQWNELWPRLCLLGDFMAAPQVLNGVDWTLRIEIIFYIIAAVISLFYKYPIIKKYRTYLVPIGMIFCAFGPSFPSWSSSTKGLLNAYFPFLILGCAVYFYEKRNISGILLITAVPATLLIFIYRVTYQGYPNLGAVLGTVAFLIAWKYDEKFKHSKIVMQMSSITYGLYLFHSWYYDYTRDFLQGYHVSPPFSVALSIVYLYAFCYLAHLVFEGPLMRAGKWIAKRPYRSTLVANPVSQ